MLPPTTSPPSPCRPFLALPGRRVGGRRLVAIGGGRAGVGGGVKVAVCGTLRGRTTSRSPPRQRAWRGCVSSDCWCVCAASGRGGRRVRGAGIIAFPRRRWRGRRARGGDGSFGRGLAEPKVDWRAPRRAATEGGVKMCITAACAMSLSASSHYLIYPTSHAHLFPRPPTATRPTAHQPTSPC